MKHLHLMCPYCQSGELYRKDIYTDDETSEVYHREKCEQCDREHTNVFTLARQLDDEFDELHTLTKQEILELAKTWETHTCMLDANREPTEHGHLWTLIPHELVKAVFLSQGFEVFEIHSDSENNHFEAESLLYTLADYNDVCDYAINI